MILIALWDYSLQFMATLSRIIDQEEKILLVYYGVTLVRRIICKVSCVREKPKQLALIDWSLIINFQLSVMIKVVFKYISGCQEYALLSQKPELMQQEGELLKEEVASQSVALVNYFLDHSLNGLLLFYCWTYEISLGLLCTRFISIEIICFWIYVEALENGELGHTFSYNRT